jgi:hypothetical protein
MSYCQLKNDSISNSSEKLVSIYEYGDSLTSCETDFKNLFRNWKNGHITNANQYRFDNFSFVETISDSARYRYYRNYFSGLEVVSNYYSTSSSGSYEGNQWKTKQKYFITPFKYKWNLLDKLPIETMIKIIKLFDAELKFNVDTVKIISAFQDSIQTIEKVQNDNSSVSTTSVRTSWEYSDSKTKKSIDSILVNHLSFKDLSIQSQEKMLTSQYLLMRVGMQKLFNEAVQIGDKAYVIPTEFGGNQFKIFVICNPVTKKVVMDYFFKGIQLPAKS